MASPSIQQTVTGDHNIFTATGDINVTYNLPPAQAEDHHNLQILLDRVNAFWVEGVLQHSMVSDTAHDLVKDQVVDAVEHPWESVLELPGQESRILGRAEAVKPVYERIGRSMLILGEPGSGKTVTLLELARDLVAAARSDPSQAVPLVLNLSSWTGQPLERWLIEELKAKYFVAERAGRPLLEKNRLALLLDGLDEVDRQRQAACIETVNAFTESIGVPGLVVCSRIGEYTALPVRLKLHGAIRLNALGDEQVDAYLGTLGDGLEGLRHALEEDHALAALARSPLMLNVMSVAYRDMSSGPSHANDEATQDTRRTEIFDAYVDRMFTRRGGAAAEPRREDERRLAALARGMRTQGQSVFTIEGLQPSWLPDTRARLVYALQSRLIVGLILGVTEGLYLGLTPVLGDAFTSTLMRSIALGLLFGLGAGVFDGLRIERSMRSTQNPRRAYFLDIVLAAIVYHLVFIAGMYLLWGQHGAIRFAFGLVWALLLALRVRTPAARTDIRAVEALSWSWKRAVKGLLVGFGVGIAFSAAIVAIVGIAYFQANPSHWTNPALLPFGYAMVGALFGGIVGTTLEKKTTPNEGMRLSLGNARFGGLLTACVIAALTPVYVLAPSLAVGEMPESLLGVALFSLLVGGYFGVLAALWFGAMDAIYHTVLCRRLAGAGVIPLPVERFLERMARVAILQRVGGGYIFVHRLLLEHFANRPG